MSRVKKKKKGNAIVEGTVVGGDNNQAVVKKKNYILEPCKIQRISLSIEPLEGLFERSVMAQVSI